MRIYFSILGRVGRLLCLAGFALSLGACSATVGGPSTRIPLGPPMTPPGGLMVYCEGAQYAACAAQPRGFLVTMEAQDTDLATGGQGDLVTVGSLDTAAEAPIHTRGQPERVEITAEHLPQIVQVNRRINSAMDWHSDLEIYGVEEHWSLPLTQATGTAGDCEDFALEKRHALLDLGLPPAALALAIVYSEATGRHAVLIVRTTDGDYVLDNTTPWIMPWSATEYTWIQIQEGESLTEWRQVVTTKPATEAVEI